MEVIELGERALVTIRSQIKTQKNFLSNATDVKSSSIHKETVSKGTHRRRRNSFSGFDKKNLFVFNFWWWKLYSEFVDLRNACVDVRNIQEASLLTPLSCSCLHFITINNRSNVFRVSILFLGLCAGISFSIHCSPNALGTCVIKIDWSRKMLKIYFSTTVSPAWNESEGKNVKSQRGMFNFKTSRGNARVNVNWNGMSWLEVALKWLHFQFAASE